MIPNTFAYLMLLAWPLVTLLLFRRLEPGRALIWTLLGAQLLLPEVAEFNLPMFPALHKFSIPNLAALLICAFILKRRISFLPKSLIGRALILVYVISPFFTGLNNSDAVRFVGWSLPGSTFYDSLSFAVSQFVFILPFFLARHLLATEAAHRDILRALMIAMLFYSVPILWEVRMSPQLSTWVYGFFPGEFGQQMRLGGFRPVVFMVHGLVVAFFVTMALISAAALARTAPIETRARYIVAVLYLSIILILCKTVSGWVYGLFSLPLVLLLNPRTQIRIAAVLALISVSYPLLTGAGLIPEEAIVAYAEIFGSDRAGSLQFRFTHQELLLGRANERPLFGWGGWGRQFIYDPVTGVNLTVPDGRWIVVIGSFGWVGFLAEFGILALPLVLLALRTYRSRFVVWTPLIGPLALLLGVNMIELLPNATLTPVTWMIVGALVGYVEALDARAKSPEPTPYRGERPPAAVPLGKRSQTKSRIVR